MGGTGKQAGGAADAALGARVVNKPAFLTMKQMMIDETRAGSGLPAFRVPGRSLLRTMAALTVLASTAVVALPREAAAIGCFSGGAAGGVAGHYAGHHAILGALAGCAVGHHARVVQRRNAAEAAAQQNGGGAYPQGGAYQQGAPVQQ